MGNGAPHSHGKTTAVRARPVSSIARSVCAFSLRRGARARGAGEKCSRSQEMSNVVDRGTTERPPRHRPNRLSLAAGARIRALRHVARARSWVMSGSGLPFGPFGPPRVTREAAAPRSAPSSAGGIRTCACTPVPSGMPIPDADPRTECRAERRSVSAGRPTPGSEAEARSPFRRWLRHSGRGYRQTSV